jgi:hypothetical protein
LQGRASGKLVAYLAALEEMLRVGFEALHHLSQDTRGIAYG